LVLPQNIQSQISCLDRLPLWKLKILSFFLIQVAGCSIDLPNKAYHQRYRICQNHAAMPQMVLDGQHVRFCQHCGKFQALQEFDGAFKSCRKSLQRHRNSQSRRVRTKSSTKASSGSDGISGGITATTRVRRNRQKRNTQPDSSTTNTTDSNNNEYSQSPYDGSTPDGSGIQTQV
jgi:SBP domain